MTQNDTTRRYAASTRAEQLLLARASAGDPELRNRLQLSIMRSSAYRMHPELRQVVASDRYHESERNWHADWPEDP